MSVESITIPVEPERKNLSKIEIKPISDCDSELEGICNDYIFTSLKPDQKIILDHGKHPVFEGFLWAYKNHRPITISPDIFWLLITQAFSNHVSSCPEKLRHMFVNFKGKKNLTVTRKDLNFYAMTSDDWEEFFPEFVNKISKFTGKDITDTLTPDFTTTTPVSLAVGQLTIMSTMKHYFNFCFEVSGCGFPYITIEGTIEDWIKISDKLSNLSKYDFKWFTNETIPIIQKIIETKKGNIDKKFWQMMLKIKNGSGFYDPDHVNGWFVSFFPFDRDGRRIYGSISTDTKLQDEVQTVPFKLRIIGQGTFDCTFLAGFVGLTQDEKTASIKPEIGWFIQKNSVDTNSCLDSESDSENEDDENDDSENNFIEDIKDDFDDSDHVDSVNYHDYSDDVI